MHLPPQPPPSGRRVLVSGASRASAVPSPAPSRRRDRVAVHYGSRREDAERTLEGLAGTGHVLAGGDLSDPAGAAPWRTWRRRGSAASTSW